jgi:hypothetical protein
MQPFINCIGLNQTSKMSKRSNDNEEHESKRVCDATAVDLYKTFFDDESPDDKFVIVRRDYEDSGIVIEVYLETFELAEQVLEHIKKRDQRSADVYEIQRLRKMPQLIPEVIDPYIVKSEPKQYK